MILQAIVDVAEIASRLGVTTAVISPGSRNAPLTLAFSRHPKINTYVVPDERSAAFIALGLAQQLNQVVAVICTSGSAVYNYAPAVAEAYYAGTSLLVLSADRPPEWIDQRDGQTINQRGIFGNHVLDSFQLPDAVTHPDQLRHVHRLTSDAINTSRGSGPVHINVPLREPFYPSKGLPDPSNGLKVIESLPTDARLSKSSNEALKTRLKEFRRIIIIPGQGKATAEQLQALSKFTTANEIPVISDVISNFSGLETSILHQDLSLGSVSQSVKERLKPDLVITCGKNLISKNLKLFLRECKPENHWHFGEAPVSADPLQSLTTTISSNLFDFLAQPDIKIDQSTDYIKLWKGLDELTEQTLEESSNDWWELSVVADILKSLPKDTILHLANSMPVRWANFINNRQDITYCANRGTSGIDGCLSTALGFALATSRPVYALLGDMAFMYDRNGLWHNYLPDNLRIIVLNNHGGGIFRLIKGPSDQPELDEFFETRQLLTCENSVRDYKIDYTFVQNRDQLLKALPSFHKSKGGCKLLEAETNSQENKTKFEELKQKLKRRLNDKLI